MPELPEVETVVRTVAPRVVGRRIRAVQAASRFVAPRPLEGAVGQAIRAVERSAKHILFVLDAGLLCIHLGMTGKLLVNAPPGPHTRVVFELAGCRLVYDDPRQFGRIEYVRELPERIRRLGPDAHRISLEEFRARLAARRSRIKPLLLDQRFLGGLGNIYTDEALFRARIHPLAPASRLGRARVERLHRAIVEVLGEAIEKGGSSISDYVDAEGRAGFFQTEHRVYGRAGEPCTACGTAIRRIEVAQRGTHYCPRCQRP
ncbi:MAG: bifunctional DNA-formamidopyrimidine glycosylase/DNA-(apurinic or apyrimidinic site) lyase [Acidobacteria bacterium]|nr:bifunctional DNA-formamidopyrimidine glycosylase/DNA-(apurinic or apyrimidinic site) lyase [Acidobacteriota bacterium]